VAIACYLGHFSLSAVAATRGDVPEDKAGDKCGDNRGKPALLEALELKAVIPCHYSYMNIGP
jgi:hypothetical protein